MTGIVRGMPGLPLEDELRDCRGLHFPERQWFSADGQGNNVVGTPVVGTYYTHPFIVFEPCDLIGLGCMIATAPSNDAVLKLGIHDHDAREFLPLNLLYGSPEISGAPLTASNPQVVTGFRVSLKRGFYWAGYMFTAGTTLTNVLQAGTGASTGMTVYGGRMPWTLYGKGAVPSIASGNDGAVATQVSLTDLPAPFAGAWVTNSNSPARAHTALLMTTRRSA